MADTISIRDFFAAKAHYAIHCDSLEKARTLLNKFNEMGYAWADGDPYSRHSNFNIFKSNTCYTNDGMYGTITALKGYEVFEFEQVEELMVKEEFSEDTDVIEEEKDSRPMPERKAEFLDKLLDVMLFDLPKQLLKEDREDLFNELFELYEDKYDDCYSASVIKMHMLKCWKK